MNINQLGFNISATEGRNSVTSYLLSLMDASVAARILEKYEDRTNPRNNTVPSWFFISRNG